MQSWQPEPAAVVKTIESLVAEEVQTENSLISNCLQ